MGTDGEAGGTVEPAVDRSVDAEARLRVFLSYSRKDGEFVAKLAEALNGPTFEASYDASPHAGKNPELGIAAEDEWWKQLERMIAAADAMVFVVSPDSIASKVCDEEILYARTMGKRVIAVLRREIDFNKAPPRLAALNVKLRFTDDSEAGFAASLAALSEALELDAAWWREQTWLAGQVKTWRDAEEDKRKDWLLSAAELARAERWAARRPPKAPQISEAELDFLAASRAHQAELAEEEARKLKVRQRLQLGVLALTVVALVVTLAGAWFVAQGQRDLARRGSAAMAAAAAAEFDAGQYDRALRLAILAGRETWLTPVASEAAFEIGRAAEFSRAVLRLPPAERGCHVLSDDGRVVAMAEGGQLVMLVQAADGAWTRQELGVVETPVDLGEEMVSHLRPCGAFAPDGSWFATVGLEQAIMVWRREGAAWRKAFAAPSEDGDVYGMAQAGRDLLLTWGAAGVTLWRAEGEGWTASHLTMPVRPPDLSGPQPGSTYGGPVNPLQGVFDADASADGARIVARFTDTAGPGVFVATRGADGTWTAEVIEETQRFLDTVQISPQGRRVLVVGESLARVFEIGPNGRWWLIAEDGQRGPGDPVAALMSPPVDTGMMGALGPEQGQPVRGARLLSIKEDGDGLAIAGPGFSARKRIAPGPNFGEYRLEADGYVTLPQGEVETMGARDDGTAAYVEMLNEVVAIDDGWLGRGSSVAAEGVGLRIAVSGDGRTVAMMERDRSVIVSRIGAAPLGLTESLTRSVQRGKPQDAATYSPTTAASAGFGPSRDDVIVVEQEADEEVIAHYQRGKDGAWTREEVAREAFGIGRAEMSAKGLIVSGSGGTVNVHSPKAGGGWSSVPLDGRAWLGARAWSWDGSQLLTITGDSRFEVWSQDAAGKWVVTGRGGEVDDAGKAVFLGADNVVASWGERGLMIWRAGEDGAWTGAPGGVDAGETFDQLVASRDGHRIAAGGPNGVRVWTLLPDGSWKSAAVSPRAARAALDDSMSLSADGKLLALSDQGDLGFVMSIWSERQDGQWVRTPITASGILNPVIQISPDRTRVLATGWEGALLANIEWLSGDRPETLTQRACAEKLPGGAGSTLRVITRADVDAAPVLQGREGEDVCGWSPAWYDGVLGTVFGWVK